MMMDDYDGQMIFGDLVGLKLADSCLTSEEKPRKNLTQETCPDGDRTRSRCVTSAHATACSTAVDINLIFYYILFSSVIILIFINLEMSAAMFMRMNHDQL